jgi:hypothetical protein
MKEHFFSTRKVVMTTVIIIFFNALVSVSYAQNCNPSLSMQMDSAAMRPLVVK